MRRAFTGLWPRKRAHLVTEKCSAIYGQNGPIRPKPAGRAHISRGISRHFHGNFPGNVAGRPGFPGKFLGRAAKFPGKSPGKFGGPSGKFPGKSWPPGNPRGASRGTISGERRIRLYRSDRGAGTPPKGRFLDRRDSHFPAGNPGRVSRVRRTMRRICGIKSEILVKISEPFAENRVQKLGGLFVAIGGALYRAPGRRWGYDGDPGRSTTDHQPGT